MIDLNPVCLLVNHEIAALRLVAIVNFELSILMYGKPDWCDSLDT